MLCLVITLALHRAFCVVEQPRMFLEKLIAHLQELVSKGRDATMAVVVVSVRVHCNLRYVMPKTLSVPVLHLPHLVPDGTKVHWALDYVEVIQSIFLQHWFKKQV